MFGMLSKMLEKFVLAQKKSVNVTHPNLYRNFHQLLYKLMFFCIWPVKMNYGQNIQWLNCIYDFVTFASLNECLLCSTGLVFDCIENTELKIQVVFLALRVKMVKFIKICTCRRVNLWMYPSWISRCFACFPEILRILLMFFKNLVFFWKLVLFLHY